MNDISSSQVIYPQSDIKNRFRALMPSAIEITLAIVISIIVIIISNLKFVAKLLEINSQNQQDFSSLVTDGFSFFINSLQKIPFSDTSVVLILNFFIIFIILSVIAFGINEYKNLRTDISDSNDVGISKKSSHLNIFLRIIGHFITRVVIDGFIIIWGLIYFLLIVPIGINATKLYLNNLTAYPKIGFLIFGCLLIFFGTLVWQIYFKYMFTKKYL